MDISHIFTDSLSSAAASIWFENWGVVDPGEKFRSLQAISPKIIDFSTQISEELRFFRQFHKKFRFISGNLKKCDFKNFDFSGNLIKSFDFLGKFRFFYRQFIQKIRFLRANFRRMSMFFR